MDLAAEYTVLENLDVQNEPSDSAELTREVETIEMWSYLMLAVGMLALTILGVHVRAPVFGEETTATGCILTTEIDMECPSAILPVAIIWSGGDALMMEMDVKAKILGAAFLAHYVHRAFLFPLALRPSARTPVIVSLLAFVFTSCNALLQASMWLQHQHWRRVGFLQFLIGITIWIAGACTNIHADYHLIHLKRSAPKDSRYPWQIPYRGIFQYVSGGAYSAEIVEWLGYGLAANHIAAFAFWGFVICNIGPRAMHYHGLYLQLYPDYPPNRKALIPGII